MGRKAKTIPHVRWHLYIPEDLAKAVELLLFDPTLGKVRHGARGELVTALLSEWRRRHQVLQKEDLTSENPPWDNYKK